MNVINLPILAVIIAMFFIMLAIVTMLYRRIVAGLRIKIRESDESLNRAAKMLAEFRRERNDAVMSRDDAVQALRDFKNRNPNWN